MLPALGYLHDRGLAFCDLKLDNVIQTGRSLKLIDLGAVHRLAADDDSPMFGTDGYQAPEVGSTGPTVASDLYTVGRTLALLCADVPDYRTTRRHTLPPQADVPVFARFDSLYRFLERATDPEPERRFPSADEMADQLLGVLREVVSATEERPVPGPSTHFTAELRTRADRMDWRLLPSLLVSADDEAAGFLATLPASNATDLIGLLQVAPAQTLEVRLRLARALIFADDVDAAGAVLDEIGRRWPGEWRLNWCRGLVALNTGDGVAAAARFDEAYAAMPGELAPKLALGMAEELSGRTEPATRWYDVVSATDPSFTSAAFGLARCRLSLGDRAGALEAYGRVPETSRMHAEAMTARVRQLVGDGSSEPDLDDLRAAAATLDELPEDSGQRGPLSAAVLEAALRLVHLGHGDPGEVLLGCPLTDRALRTSLERTYRARARAAETTADRIRLVDAANRVRPRTWT
jgi:serine/threonine-protein kinase PknG